MSLLRSIFLIVTSLLTSETKDTPSTPVQPTPTEPEPTPTDSTNAESTPSPETETPDLNLLPPPTYATRTATKALYKALREVLDYQVQTRKRERGWVLDVEEMGNLYQWTVRLTDLDESLPLQKDLRTKGPAVAERGITLEVRFGPDFPSTPPYIRVVTPRLLQFINGGGGHVTAGGSVCLNILTTTGWKKSYSLPSIFLEVRLAITSTDPRPARLDTHRGWDKPYTAQEAMQAFVRVARDHGWGVPRGWQGHFAK
ncbi:hypothetical protein HDV00_002288 [Rhizophlyctis rosea]|nr:hypothetical protein HDV00_002288 [Rhizophlyctis rosea]